jgi:hypothetical protein
LLLFGVAFGIAFNNSPVLISASVYEENRQQLRQRFQEKDKNDRLTKIENNALKKKKSRNNIGGMNAFSLREPLYGTWFRSDTNFCN